MTVFDPMPLFCDGNRCRLTEEGSYLFFDGGHYALAGSRRVARALASQLESVLARSPATLHTTDATERR